jgi:hypothetical protein
MNVLRSRLLRLICTDLFTLLRNVCYRVSFQLFRNKTLYRVGMILGTDYLGLTSDLETLV